eukprot:350375-Chlamydomonas_euryale.AAC.4
MKSGTRSQPMRSCMVRSAAENACCLALRCSLLPPLQIRRAHAAARDNPSRSAAGTALRGGAACPVSDAKFSYNTLRPSSLPEHLSNLNKPRTHTVHARLPTLAPVSTPCPAAVGCRVKYIVDTPEVIWGSLDSSQYLEAARRLLRAHTVHALLLESFSERQRSRFPLLAHQGTVWAGRVGSGLRGGVLRAARAPGESGLRMWAHWARVSGTPGLQFGDVGEPDEDTDVVGALAKGYRFDGCGLEAHWLGGWGLSSGVAGALVGGSGVEGRGCRCTGWKVGGGGLRRAHLLFALRHALTTLHSLGVGHCQGVGYTQGHAQGQCLRTMVTP